ncbi:hypothetical protein T265_06787 [Opisthorchis viverrini]|uniref:Uncharacterized protein n=1 Tax=Opisthorchis viverrini TaxID=6198 RepID=A0A074ZF48_OPIVI|nr:hypothetical protein T265_06787 [Opisthorchis viverrini]KER25808.1 hypothetical protein T265_06787 [Opisthorchis viverrini]
MLSPRLVMKRLQPNGPAQRTSQRPSTLPELPTFSSIDKPSFFDLCLTFMSRYSVDARNKMSQEGPVSLAESAGHGITRFSDWMLKEDSLTVPDLKELEFKEFEKLTKCKKRLANPEASTHFGRILRFTEDPLHSSDFDDPETEMKRLPRCDELEQAGEVSSKRTVALNEMSRKFIFAPSPAYAHPSWTEQTRLQETESHCLREETQLTPKFQVSSNSQKDLHQVEPNSLLEDEMAPASPDASQHQRKRSPSSSIMIPQPSVHKAPTILKWTSPSANLRSSTLCSNANHARNRRSRVVFSRTVMVSNGLETTQLNCPSETDDEDDSDFHRACPRLTLDDMVINRTSEPWHSASRFDTKSCKQSSRQHRRFLRALETFTRPDKSQSPFYNYLADNSTDLMVSETEKSTPVVQRPRHHHNCQALRQNTKVITSPADVMFGSFN